ncbi:MAG: hypothetical protein NTY88_05130 [Bacteroidetes bacterium]|nr:hypothetical protein [Bacteroidota bacterium]
MASSTETGNAVNISNFKLLIDKCTGFGATYNPGNTDLTIANMTTKWTAAGAAQDTINTALQNSKQPINAREEMFKPLSKGATRVLNYLNSTSALKGVKKDAKGLADKIRGFGKKKAKPAEGGAPAEEGVSTSHQSYVQRADSVKQLIELLKTVPQYTPNETDLKVTELEIYYGQIKAANDNIGTIIAPVEDARIARDHVLYDEETGIVDLALACKKYVKSVYGATAPETKTVTGIKFTRPKKK